MSNDLDHKQALLELMDLLDRANNVFGALDPDIRARLFAVIETPNQITWSAAHSILVNGESFTTLWEACNKHAGYQVRTKAMYGFWPEIPTRAQILTALRGELRPKSTHHHEDWQIRDSAKGGRYCAACGDPVPDSPDEGS